MSARLSVGLAANCLAPLRLQQAQERIAALMRVASLMVPDHYQGFVPRAVWRPETMAAAKHLPSLDAFFDPFVLLGSMASRLPRRIRLGTGVTEPFRRHPATLAQAFVTLDHLTRGRAICGIGNGERENTTPYGIPFTKRVGRLEEALEIMQRLWHSRGEPITFDGSFWKLDKAVFRTPLYNHRAPCVWLAAHAPRMLGLAGRYADGWYPTLKMTPADYTDKLGIIRTATRDAGRDPARFEPGLQIMIALGKDRRTTLAALGRLPVAGALTLLLPGAVWAKHGLRHPLGDDYEGAAQFVPEEVTLEQMASAQRLLTPDLLLEGAYAGSIDDVVREVRALVAAGLRHVVISDIGPLITGGRLSDFVRLWTLIRRLRRIEVPPR